MLESVALLALHKAEQSLHLCDPLLKGFLGPDFPGKLRTYLSISILFFGAVMSESLPQLRDLIFLVFEQFEGFIQKLQNLVF